MNIPYLLGMMLLARPSYDAGRKAFREGDFATARPMLVNAMLYGYQPTAFEQSPERMLEHLDEMEKTK